MLALATATPETLRPVALDSGGYEEPDGRWLLAGWPEADQFLFLRLPGAVPPCSFCRSFAAGVRHVQKKTS